MQLFLTYLLILFALSFYRIDSLPSVSFDADSDNSSVFLPSETGLQSCAAAAAAAAAGKITAEQRRL